MDTILLLISIITFIYLLISLFETSSGLKSIASLTDVNLDNHSKQPLISIIVTARDEAAVIGDSIALFCQQDYANFEIICVNDRSSDSTGDILNQLAALDHRVKVVHIKELPEKWIGKNYASYRGAELAKGEWLLFMDADVKLHTEVLKRTIAYAQQNKLDHLTVLPTYQCTGFLYNIYHLVFKGHGYVINLKPWLAKSKKSKRSINSGVFCLIKTAVYQAIGGHKAIALKCIDDLELGKRIKHQGYSQDIVDAQAYISITWYETLGGMFNGLKKNCFAYFYFNFLLMILASVAWTTLLIWPVIASFVTSGWCQFFNILNVAVIITIYCVVAKFFNVSRLYAFLFPLGTSIYLYPLYASAFHFIANKGIYWRDTFYPAALLKGK